MPNFNIEANQGPKTFIMGPSGFVADVTSLGQLLTTGGGGGGGAFPQTVSGTVVSGGIPYFSSTTLESSSALLAANAVVLGGGPGGAPFTSASLTTDGVGTLTLVRVFTAIGTALAPAYSFSSSTGSGMSFSNGNGVVLSYSTNFAICMTSLYAIVPAASVIGWTPSTIIANQDTGISRLGAGSLAIGNGTAGGVTGTLSLAAMIVNTAKWSSGALTPNTNVVGSVGDLYTWTGGTTSTTLWVKEVGSANNTGWVAK